MRRALRRGALTILKGCGGFKLVQDSRWRRERLLILCYHGISLDDEHQWRPGLYVQPSRLERRLQILSAGKYTLLPLGEALQRLYRRDLPPRSVAITFDDGTHDFYSRAYPLLRKFGFPATVYLTTYYTDLELPVFSLICSYMMWKSRDRGTISLNELGIARPIDLTSPRACESALVQISQWVDSQNLSGMQKNDIAARLAEQLNINYAGIMQKRILQLMNRRELKELADAGVDLQLHTHRHRTPRSEALFRKEIRDNREKIAEIVPGARTHFCYPSGVYENEFLGWLAADGIVSATTCDTGLATADSNPLLLPRFVDTTGRNDLEFESWVNGIGDFLSTHKPAHMPD
jgi:peptidoglycan/xylan/chitin deacetylase (PgdA/CDA1 family)